MNLNFKDNDEYGKNLFVGKGGLNAEDLLNFLEDLESEDIDLSQISIVFQEGHRFTEIRDVIDDINDNGIIVLKK
jgi:hypothetical protein